MCPYMCWENSIIFSNLKTGKSYYNFKCKNLFLKYVKIIILIFYGMFLTIKGNKLTNHLKIQIWLYYLIFKYSEYCVYIIEFLSVSLSCFLIANPDIWGSVPSLLCDWLNHTFVRTQAAQLHIMAATRKQQNKTVTITWRTIWIYKN
jgi:hypothetical protein